MYPHERSLVKRWSQEKFALIGVNSDPNKALLRARMEEENITWRSFWCGAAGAWGRIPSQWGVRGWPTIYLIDANGVIRHNQYMDEAELDKAIDALVAEVNG